MCTPVSHLDVDTSLVRCYRQSVRVVAMWSTALHNANSHAPYPPYWSWSCGGCQCCWRHPGTWRTAGGQLGKLTTECFPLPAPSLYRSWSFHRDQRPQHPQASGRRWWCRCWGPAWLGGTCQQLSCAGRALRGSHRGQAPVWWLVPLTLTCRQMGMTPLWDHEPGPGSPVPTWIKRKPKHKYSLALSR